MSGAGTLDNAADRDNERQKQKKISGETANRTLGLMQLINAKQELYP